MTMGSGPAASNIPETIDRVASEKRAKLVRDQWNDYKRRFVPIENTMLKIAGDGPGTSLGTEGIARAQQGVNQAYGSAAGMMQRDQSRYGLSNTPELAQTKQSELSLAKSESMGLATNTAREWDIDRRNAVMGGGLGQASQIGRG